MNTLARGRRSLGFLLRESSLMMRRRFVHHARKAGLPLNRSEASLLWHVSHEPGIIQATVAQHLDMETITVARLVDGLERGGLLERRPHAADRRMRTLWLTQAGDAAAERIRGINDIVRAEALDGIPPAQREALLDLLLTVRTNLAQATQTERSNAA